MGLISRGIEDVSNDGLTGLNRAFYRITRAGIGSILQYTVGSGTNVFKHEWDALIILDACRADLMAEVVSEYDFITTSETIQSVGSSTPEWMNNTFTEEYRTELKKTAYITGNPFSENILDPSDFYALEEVWRDVWDEEMNTIPARPITDRVIHVSRTMNPDRIVAHYMQPHATFIPQAEKMQVEGNQDSIWMALREGELDREEIWTAYIDNLRYVLDDVSLLLDNIDANKAIITSDHGNAMGEYGVYGHPSGYPLSSLREVPWIETSAHDRRTHEPEIKSDPTDRDISDQLKDLGYYVE